MPDVPDFLRNTKGSPRRGTPRGSSSRTGSARSNTGAAPRPLSAGRPGARPRQRVDYAEPRHRQR